MARGTALPEHEAQRPLERHDAWNRTMRIDQTVREWREQRGRRHGLVPTVSPYAGYGSTTWIRVLGRVLLGEGPLKPSTRSVEFVRGWRSFTSVPVNDVAVRVRIGDEHHFVRADHGGVIDARLDAELTPGWHTVYLRPEDPENPDAVEVPAPIFVLDPDEPFGIVSDIDDTVMVTALPRPLLAAWNTFVLDEHARTPTPGMAVLYDRLVREHPTAPVIYLSTGPWNVAPALTRFLNRNLYPSGPLLLTDWGPTPDRFFRSGRAHKVAQLQRLAEEFPDRRWLLIGDDGQHDEDTYGGFARAHRENVAAICIRQLSASEAVLAGGRSREHQHESETDVDWVYAPDGKGLAGALQPLGFLH
jgi:phosphatidate phosphatase APP1